MNYKVGDKVKFLDTTGGGVIRKILDSRMVLVAVEGGFEIPTLTSELVKMDNSEAGQRFFNETYDIHGDHHAETEEVEPDNRISILPGKTDRNSRAEEVFLAFVPQDQKWLITGIIDIFLINNSSNDILYNLFRNDGQGQYSGVDYGSLQSGTRLLLASVDREQLSDWSGGYLQLLFHKDRCRSIPLPVNAGYEIEGKKFYTEGSYRTSPVIEGKGIVIKIAVVGEGSASSEKKTKEKEKTAEKNLVVNDLIFKHQISGMEAEVDLHLTSLTEAGKIEPSEILPFQISYLLKILESAIANKFRKVTIIHGVGDGVLRDAVLRILEGYPKIKVFDAPIHQYGTGAIEIRIPFNMQSL